MIRFIVLLLCLEMCAFGIDMKVGETKVLRFSNEAQLKVSRKGVIDIEVSKDGGWRVFALRKGVVTITPIVDDQEEAKVLLRVFPSEKINSKHAWGKWKSFLCGPSSVKCDSRSGLISGQVSSWSWFSMARHICAKNQPCLFNVQLNSKGMEAAREFFQPLLPDVRITLDGRVIVEKSCLPKNKRANFQKHLQAYIYYLCNRNPTSYLFKSHIFWLREDEAEHFGIDPWGVLGGNLLAKNSHRLYSFLEKNKQRVVANPEMRMSLGQKGEIHQGFDLVVATRDDESKVLKGGVEAQVTIKDTVEERALLAIDIDLRVPGADERSFESAKLSSELWLPLGKDIDLGKVTVNMKKMIDGENGILSHVPIIAPLFKEESKNDGNGILLVSVQVDRFDFHEKE